LFVVYFILGTALQVAGLKPYQCIYHNYGYGEWGQAKKQFDHQHARW
jgi:hypothetical protein